MRTWQRFFAVGQAGDGTKLTGAVQVPTTMPVIEQVLKACLGEQPFPLSALLVQPNGGSRRFAPLDISESWMWWVEILLQTALEPSSVSETTQEKLADLLYTSEDSSEDDVSESDV